MDIIAIPMKEILQDFFFCFTTNSEKANLKNAIKASGIRNPIRVLRAENGFQILSGFSRYQVARDLKHDVLPCTIEEEKSPIEEAFREVLLEHLVCRNLNLVEKARILSILSRSHVKIETIRMTFLPLLDMPDRKEVLQETLDILQFSPRTLAYIEMYDLSLKQVRIFHKLAANEEKLLIGLAIALQIRAVEFIDIISLFLDIAGRENRSIGNIFDELYIQRLIEDSESSRTRKLNHLKEILRRKRYPMLYSWNDRMIKLVKKMKSPPLVEMKWDTSLEKPGVELTARLITGSDVDRLADFLSDERHRQQLKQLFDVV